VARRPPRARGGARRPAENRPRPYHRTPPSSGRGESSRGSRSCSSMAAGPRDRRSSTRPTTTCGKSSARSSTRRSPRRRPSPTSRTSSLPHAGH
jgi:hypothetical protein